MGTVKQAIVAVGAQVEEGAAAAVAARIGEKERRWTTPQVARSQEPSPEITAAPRDARRVSVVVPQQTQLPRRQPQQQRAEAQSRHARWRSGA